MVHIDALSLTLVAELSAAGRMPVFSDLRRRGTWHSLDTPALHFPASSYFSLLSGYEPGDHGLYFSFQWSPQEQRLRYRLDFGTPTTVWERLADAGRRSLVLDPYELGPPTRIEGLALSGWQYRNILSLERWSVPAGWERPYDRRHARGPFMQEVFGRRGPRALETWRRVMLGASPRMADLAVDVLGREQFDVVYLSLLGPHQAGHLFWNVAELDVDERSRSQLEGALAEIYEGADHALGRIVDALPDGADVIVVSPLGMGPNTSLIDLTGPMLERVLAGEQAETKESGDRIWRLRGAVPMPVRATVARALGGHLAREVTARLSTSGVDWPSTRAFLLPSDENGQIRLNLRGREREGIVDPAEADEVLTEIAEGVLSFRHADGTPVAQAVDRSAGLYPGRRSELLPDLVVRWSQTPQSQVRSVHSDRYGEVVRRPGSGTGRNGAHTAEAFALVVPGSSRLRTPHRRVRVSDVAATILASHGLDPEPASEPLLG
jgi:predicted AlkP superfamily phosphohydrolase/phosphomutase